MPDSDFTVKTCIICTPFFFLNSKAENSYHTAHVISPDDSDVLLNLGSLYCDHHCLDKAEAAYQTALVIAPDARIYCNLGVLPIKNL